MLVLTRREDEKIYIGDEIRITVVGIENGKVKLGIEAPDEVEIHREEVYERIVEENLRAAERKVDISKLSRLRFEEDDGDKE